VSGPLPPAELKAGQGYLDGSEKPSRQPEMPRGNMLLHPKRKRRSSAGPSPATDRSLTPNVAPPGKRTPTRLSRSFDQRRRSRGGGGLPQLELLDTPIRRRKAFAEEVNYLTWTFDNLLRQVAYVGLREDKPARDVQRPVPHPKSRD
jgi:hypothetical protein